MKLVPSRFAVLVGGLSLGILAVGFVAMRILIGLREPPAQAAVEERKLSVDAVRATYEDVPVLIEGYGEVRARDVVSLSPEVAGRIIHIHPRLEAGEVISEGETLFIVDPRDYQARLDEAEAEVDRVANTIARIKKQYEIDKSRLTSLYRNRDLSKDEFERESRLFKQGIGTQAAAELAERNYELAVDRASQLEQQVELYPIQIREAENSLARAEAQRNLAKANRDRTVVAAPFDARIKTVNLEQGQYVTPGVDALTLADDSVLEISVPLDSVQVRKWLRFKKHHKTKEMTPRSLAWFSDLYPAPARITWTDGEPGYWWDGRVHRVEKFDQETRTITIAVRVEGEAARSVDPDHLPLVEGMFCQVVIPGREVRDVVRLPSNAVSFEDTVYAVDDNRLVTKPIEVSHRDGDYIYVRGGITPGEMIITTTLVNPLERTLLSVNEVTLPSVES